MSEGPELSTRFDPAAHPRPWRMVESAIAFSVVDDHGCEIMAGDPDDREFFAFILRAVNALEPPA